MKVFITGCFDRFHIAHLISLKKAAILGELYVGVGSDETIKLLKGREPYFNQHQRLEIIKELRCVKDAWINGGLGSMDFVEEILRLRPDYLYIVKEDIALEEKKNFCEHHGIELIIGERTPNISTTKINEDEHTLQT